MNRLLKIVCAATAVLVLSLGGVGCQRPVMRAETPAMNDADFFMNLAYKDVASLADGYRAVALLHSQEAEEGLLNAADAREYLVSEGIVPRSWHATGEAPLTKGELAYMVCQSLGLKGGVTMRIFGPSKRYCLYEASYQELMVGGADYQYVSGGELVSTIDRADRYVQKREGQAAEDAPVEPAAAAAQGDNQ